MVHAGHGAAAVPGVPGGHHRPDARLLQPERAGRQARRRAVRRAVRDLPFYNGSGMVQVPVSRPPAVPGTPVRSCLCYSYFIMALEILCFLFYSRTRKIMHANILEEHSLVVFYFRDKHNTHVLNICISSIQTLCIS